MIHPKQLDHDHIPHQTAINQEYSHGKSQIPKIWVVFINCPYFSPFDYGLLFNIVVVNGLLNDY
jgi:hypothetical protein